MKISELQPKQAFDVVEADIIEVGPVREFQKFGKPGRVCTAVVKDDSGKCNFSLWNEQVDQVKVGDKVKIENGYANEWQGQVQVSTGRNGSLTVVGSAEPSEEPAESSEEAAPEPDLSDEVEEEEIN